MVTTPEVSYLARASLPNVLSWFEMAPSSSPSQQSQRLVWQALLLLALLHLLALLTLFLLPSAHWCTLLASQVFAVLSTFGVLSGAHRFWAHRSFSANTPLRLLLAALQTMALQGSIHAWVRNHRAHAQCTSKDVEAHFRGVHFLSHVSWLRIRKPPLEVRQRREHLNLDDLKEDAIVRLQRRWYLPLVFLLCGFIPVAIPVFCWGESLLHSLSLTLLLRYVASLHLTWLIQVWPHLDQAGTGRHLQDRQGGLWREMLNWSCSSLGWPLLPMLTLKWMLQ